MDGKVNASVEPVNDAEETFDKAWNCSEKTAEFGANCGRVDIELGVIFDDLSGLLHINIHESLPLFFVDSRWK